MAEPGGGRLPLHPRRRPAPGGTPRRGRDRLRGSHLAGSDRCAVPARSRRGSSLPEQGCRGGLRLPRGRSSGSRRTAGPRRPGCEPGERSASSPRGPASSVRRWRWPLPTPTPISTLASLSRLRGRRKTPSTPCGEPPTLAPSDASARVELGSSLHDLGRHAEAHSAFGEALGLDSRCLDARPRLRAAHEASSIAALKEGIRSEVAKSRHGSRWALRPVVALMERLPSLPGGAAAVLTVVLLVLATYVTARVFGPYWNHYTFKDEIVEIGHAPLRDDMEIRSRIFEAAERHHLWRATSRRGSSPSRRARPGGGSRAATRSRWHSCPVSSRTCGSAST